MRNAIQYQLADTERCMIDYEDDRDELRLRFDWLTKKCHEGGLQFNPDDLPQIVWRNALATAAPAAIASGLAAADSSTLVPDISPYGPDTSQHYDDDTRLDDCVLHTFFLCLILGFGNSCFYFLLTYLLYICSIYISLLVLKFFLLSLYNMHALLYFSFVS